VRNLFDAIDRIVQKYLIGWRLRGEIDKREICLVVLTND
jgi:hypothetical protein